METLYSYDNIRGTAAWYYKKWPGFYNVECYKILKKWEGGVRTNDQILLDKEQQQKEGNKKRPLEDEKTELDIIDELPFYKEEVGEYEGDTSV